MEYPGYVKWIVIVLVIAVGAGGYLWFANKDEPMTVEEQIMRDVTGPDIVCDAGSCRVDKVAGDYAKGTMLGGYFLAVKTNGKWEVAVGGNGIPTCAEVDQYSIPQEIFGNCIEADGQLRLEL